MLTCFPTVSIARGREQNARGLPALNETFSHFNSVAGTRVLVSLPKATNRLLLDLQESVLTSLSRARQQYDFAGYSESLNFSSAFCSSAALR